MPGGQGRILRATFSGNARSAQATMQGMLADLAQQYFDGRPQVVAAVASQDDQRAQAIFHAGIGGVASTGLMVVELQQGSGRMSVLHDDATRFRSSLGQMAQVAGGGAPSVGWASWGGGASWAAAGARRAGTPNAAAARTSPKTPAAALLNDLIFRPFFSVLPGR